MVQLFLSTKEGIKDMHTKNNNRIAFTLAETLVALAVIGIIAAVTIPTLLKHKQEEELRIAFKKVYSDIAQATKKMVLDNGGSLKGMCGYVDHQCLRDKYKNYLKIMKSCDTYKANGVCWHANNSSKYFNGTTYPSWGNTATVILNNNMLVKFWMMEAQCNSYEYSKKGDCGAIVVDVNGFKKPNTLGRDIFFIHVQEDGVNPWGVPDDTGTGAQTATCVSNQLGWGCAVYALQNRNY